MLASSRSPLGFSSGFASVGLCARRASRRRLRASVGTHLLAEASEMGPSSTADDREAATVNLFRNYELRTAFAQPERRRLPTTLVTGWLGSGKTTVMRHVLANRQDLRVACAVNDFAELNIDAALVAREENGARRAGKDGTGIVELTNGCLCCTLGGELETEVWQMLDSASRDDEGVGSVDYLLIETSGLVDPTETVAALDKKFGKLARVRLDSVVCVVDAESAAAGGGSLQGTLEDDAANAAWARQLSAADVVLLNKIDLLEGDDADVKLAAARAFVLEWAPDARLVECVRESAPPDDPGRRARAAAGGEFLTRLGQRRATVSALPNRRRTAQSPSRPPVPSSSTLPSEGSIAPPSPPPTRTISVPSPSRAARSLSPRSSVGSRPSFPRAASYARKGSSPSRRNPTCPTTSTSPAFDAWRSNPRVKTRRRDDARRPPVSARAASERPRRRLRQQPDLCSSDPASTPKRPSRDSARWRRTSRWKGSSTRAMTRLIRRGR